MTQVNKQPVQRLLLPANPASHPQKTKPQNGGFVS